MDPFAALGAAAAIAQFIEQGISLVNGARQIHKSAFGSTAENQQLGTVIQELKILSKRMVSQKARYEQSDAERSLSDVASECQILSEKILGLLEKMRAKDPSSFRQSAFAALRSAWNDKEKKELVEQVQKCRSMMHTQLTVILGSSTMLRLDNLIKTGNSNADELSSLRKNVDALRSGVKLTEIGPDIEQQLCKLLNISDTAINAVTQYRILNSLDFNEMHKRFDSVGNANHKTYEWILDEAPGRENSEATELKEASAKEDTKTLEKRALFRRWLRSGSEVFHIAGKLGSGKSTLMKFLCNDRRSTSLLEAWAAGRQLVVAKFFFWKPGTEMENSINGMVRTLLYDVLRQCPDLISLVFPDQWQQVQELPWQATGTLRLNGEEVNTAFYRFIDYRNSGKRRCFCFFIDGLDELDSAGRHDEGDLIDILSRMAQCIPEDPQRNEDIKLCVSSREENAFMESFSPLRRLKLQDLNRIDLVTFVQERLTSHKRFSTLQFTQKTTQEQFIDQITDQAAGVFLWATLVTITLRKGLDDGDELSELQGKLDTTPSDMENLFSDLIGKIHMRDRQQSARTFCIISALWKYCQDDRMALFAYSFLDDFTKDPDFAIKLPIGLRISNKEITQRLDRARKQLIGRCRGLVEIRDRLPGFSAYERHPFVANALAHEITVVHRSIHEFLDITENKNWMEQYLESFSPLEAIWQSTIAMIKHFSPIRAEDTPEEADHINALNFHREILQTLYLLCENGLDIDAQSKIVTSLGALLPRPQSGHALVLPVFIYFPQMGNKFSMGWYLESVTGFNFHDINHLAAQVGLFDYLIWAFDPGRDVTYEPWEFVGLLTMAFDHERFDEKELCLPACACIESIFKLGISPNMTTTRPAAQLLAHVPEETSLSIWELFFNRRCDSIFAFTTQSLRLVEILLKFGADPRISITPASPDGVEKSSQIDTHEIIINFTPSSKQQIHRSTWMSDFVGLVRTYGKAVTLRDIFEYLIKQNEYNNLEQTELGRRCLALIERNLELIEKSPNALEDLSSLMSEEERSLPIREEDKSPVPSPQKAGVEEKERSLDQGQRSNIDNDSQVKKYVWVEEAQIFLGTVLRTSFAPFVTGIVITYLYFHFMSR